MHAQLIGARNVSFVNKEGQPVNGIRIYITFKEENVDGLCAAEIFLREGINLPKDTKLNDTIDVVFNRKGKVEMIFKVN